MAGFVEVDRYRGPVGQSEPTSATLSVGEAPRIENRNGLRGLELVSSPGSFVPMTP